MIHFLWQLLIGIVLLSISSLFACFAYSVREHKQRRIAWLLMATCALSAALALFWQQQRQQRHINSLQTELHSLGEDATPSEANNLEQEFETCSATDVPMEADDALSIEALSQQLEQATTESQDDTPALIAEENNTSHDSLTECTSSDETIRMLQKQLEQATQTLAERDAAIMVLQAELESFSETFSQDNANLMLQIETLSEEREILSSQQEELLTQIEVLMVQRDSLEGQLTDSAQQSEVLSEQNAHLTEELAAMMAEQEELLAQIEELRLERAALSEQIAALQAVIASLEAELAASQATE